MKVGRRKLHKCSLVNQDNTNSWLVKANGHFWKIIVVRDNDRLLLIRVGQNFCIAQPCFAPLYIKAYFSHGSHQLSCQTLIRNVSDIGSHSAAMTRSCVM